LGGAADLADAERVKRRDLVQPRGSLIGLCCPDENKRRENDESK
jgi:hypothetical protein